MTRTLRTVPLKDIATEYPGWQNPRLFTGLSDGELEDLAMTIKTEKDKGDEDGILDPPKVVQVKTPEGNIITLAIDGQRRLLAGGRVLPKNTPIEVVDLEDKPIVFTPEKGVELLLKALKMGSHRRELGSYELSEVAQRLRDADPPASLEEIAESIDKSESWVSKILKARGNATPKLMTSWRNGDITDEQFKELAAEKEPEKQIEATKNVVETRKSGDKASARAATKEIAETAKQKKARLKKEKLEAKAAAKAEKARIAAEKKQAKLDAKAAKKAGTKNGHKPEQAEMAWTAPPAVTPEAAKPKKPPAPSRFALEEMIALADKRPPTHDLVKGIIMGVRHAIGELEIHDFGKPWLSWISRVQDVPAGAVRSAAAAKKKSAKRAPGKVKAKAPARKAKSKPKAKARKR